MHCTALLTKDGGTRVGQARGQLQEGEQELGQGVDTRQALDEVLQSLPPRLQHLGAGVPDSLGRELRRDQAQLLGLFVETVEGGVSPLHSVVMTCLRGHLNLVN